LTIYKSHFTEKESDITIISESKNAITSAKQEFYRHRADLERYIKSNNEFQSTFSPIRVKTQSRIINLMAEGAWLCDVGPMATVAGALADLMLEAMKTKSISNLVPARIALVENGGEIAVDSEKPMKIALYAGENKLNLNIGFLIEKQDCPIGIASSSAKIGHAISLGQSDVVTIFAKNATIADGAATQVGNLVKGEDIDQSIRIALEKIDHIEGVEGALICREDKIGYAGKLPKMFHITGEKDLILQNKFAPSDPEEFEIIK
jgi:ApbE superfamily uncharacterized protein (UPF0280 family)